MNATERQSQGTGIYAEEAIQLPANEGSRAGSVWLFLRAWAFRLTPALFRRESGERGGPLAKSPRGRFRPTVRSSSPITPAASPEWQPNQAQSNQIKVNQASLTSQTRRSGNRPASEDRNGEKIKITKRTQIKKRGSDCPAND